VCDGGSPAAGPLLEVLQAQDLGRAAEVRRERGWLSAALPRAVAADVTVAFTVQVIEAFFEGLHGAYPGEAQLALRRSVGAQLEAALEAERRSTSHSLEQLSRDELVACSRATSVLPFQIIQALVRGDPDAATLLGEAMWLIDDLVDLRQDARSGALNGVLLAGLDCDMPRATARAADSLLAGLELAGGRDRRPAAAFRYFVQRYAGIEPGADG
jgi:hypothetical protein